MSFKVTFTQVRPVPYLVLSMNMRKRQSKPEKNDRACSLSFYECIFAKIKFIGAVLGSEFSVRKHRMIIDVVIKENVDYNLCKINQPAIQNESESGRTASLFRANHWEPPSVLLSCISERVKTVPYLPTHGMTCCLISHPSATAALRSSDKYLTNILS